MEAEIREFCSACHVFPPPSSFPASAWEREVRQGFEFYERSQRSDLHPPEMALVVEWFRARAPQSLEIPAAESEFDESTLQLTRGRLAALPADGPFAVSHLTG